MGKEIEIVVVEDTSDDNGFSWVSGALRFGELDATSVNDMVTKVIAEAGSKQIKHLYIIGHAAPGDQSVGAGQSVDPSGDKALTIDTGTGQLVGRAETELLRLSGKFAPEAVITLGGCNVAKGEQGKALLKRISKLLGNVRVQGSDSTQRPLPGMEGNVIRCQGDTCWVQSANWLADSDVKKKKK
jgi:hypothetical protein